MLVFVNSPVPLDLFQKPSLHSSIVKSLSNKEKKYFFSGLPSNNYLTGKYIIDKCIVNTHSVDASSGLTRKTHNS